MDIHYDIISSNITTHPNNLTISQQWETVMLEVQKQSLGEQERARLAFNIVNYITSDDLPIRLLITRAPQAMAKIATETNVHKEHRQINGKKSGIIYSKQEVMLPKTITTQSHFTVNRVVDGTSKPLSSDNLIDCLQSGDIITPLDGILFLKCKRIASDIERLRKGGNRSINMKRIIVSDSFTGTTRKMASYQLNPTL